MKESTGLKQTESVLKTKLKKNILSFAMIFLALFSFVFTQAQSTANYAFSTNTMGSLALDTNANTVDMSTGTTQLVAASSDATASVVNNIGFNFILMGNVYSQFSASADGMVGLGSVAVSGATNGTASVTTPKISALGGDLYVGSNGKVHYKVVGTAPNRCLVVEFNNMAIFYSTSLVNTINTYQVRLYETTGVVEYVYGNMFCGSTTYAPAYVGFSVGSLVNKNASITTSTNTVSTAATFATNTYTANTNITNLHSSTDGSRTVYKFTPPNVVMGDANNITFNTVTANTTTVAWNDNATNEAGFLVTRATDAAFTQNVTNVSVASTTAAGTGTAYTSVQTGLSAGTTYYYKVVAIVEAGASVGITGNQATLNGTTYYWTGVTGGLWNTFANWNTAADGTGAVPTAWATSDVYVIDGAGIVAGGALAISVDRTSFTVGQIKITSNTNLTLTSSATTTRTITVSGGPADDFVLEAGSTLNLDSLTNAIAFAFSGSGNTGVIAGTYIASGSTSNTINTTGGTGTLVKVTAMGNVTSNLNSSSGCITGNATSLLFENGSNYTQSNSTTTNYIPTATWQPNATATLNGNTTGTGLTSGSTSLGNLVVNTTASTATLSAFTSNTRTIQGDLTINSTGTGRFRAKTSGLVIILGNLNINAGIFEVGSTTGGGVIVKGTTTVALGATLDCNQSILQNEGNMVNNGSVLSSETTTTNSALNFLGTTTAQTLSGTGTFTGRISSFGVSNPMGLTVSTPVLTQRVNLFTGLITGSSNITIGTGLALNAAVQVGVAANTASGGNFDVAPIFNLGTGSFTVIYSNETTPRVTGLEIPASRSINFLILDNVNGLNINGGTLEVLSGLTLTNGIVNANLANHIIHGSATAEGTLTGGSATSYINGPIVRTINNTNSATNYVLYPVGKAGVYAPVYLAPTTTSVAKFSAEAFDINSGTADASIIGLTTTRRWNAIPISGTFTDIKVRLADASIAATNIPVQAPTAAGVYTSTFGSVATYTAGTPNTTQSNNAAAFADYTGYLSYANSNACSGTPAPGNTVASSATICLGSPVTLSLQNDTAGTGVTYQWKSSPDDVTYTDVTSATSATLTVSPTTAMYYKCDVTCTTGPAMGTSTAVQITFTNNVTATTPATRCGTGTATLDATPNSGAAINWYAGATGGAALATGNSFTTPSISATTTYYAEASTGSSVNVGPISPTAQGGTIGTQTIAWNNNFTVTQATQLTSVDVFPITSGQTASIALRDNSGVVISTVNYTTNVSGGATLQTIPLNFSLTPGSYQLYPTLPTSGVSRNTSGSVYPYTSSVANITGNGFDATYFMGMYNWKFGASCASPRVAVVATVTTPPTLTLSDATKTICNGSTSTAVTVTSTVADYDSYVWAPATGVSGNSTTGWTFNPTATTTYTLTASQTAGSMCVITATVAVTVNPVPSAITFSPTAPTTCVNSILTLAANGGTIGSSGSTAIGTDTTLTIENGIEPTAFNNRYEHYWLQMVFTQAELNAAGIQAGNINGVKFNIASIGSAAFVSDFRVNLGSTTLNSLTGFVPTGLTEVYSAATYTQAIGVNSIVFSTPYIWDGTSNIIVDIRSTGVDTTNNSQTYYTATPDNKTVSAVTSTTFASSNAYVASNPSGTLSLKRLNTTFDWTSSVPTNISWSPATNLYTDAAATTAYVLGASASTVYVKSATAATTTYTAMATSGASCSVSNTVSVVVNALPTIVTVAPTAVCAPATVDLTASAVTTGSDSGLTFTYFSDASSTTTLTTASAVTASGTYYIKGTNANGCSAIASVVVTINALPTVVTVAPTAVCSPATVDLTASAVTTGSDSGLTFTYFTDAAATTTLTTASAVTTSGTYYIKGTNANGCSAIASVVVTITVTNAPTGDATQTFCGSSNMSLLVVTGTAVKWYDMANGGTQYPSALLSSIGLVNGTVYYASQTVNGCESTTRLAVTAVVNAIPTAPNATAQSLCSSSTVTNLVPSGAAYNWYSMSTGGTALASTDVLATGDYYVSQTINGCESTRTLVSVTIVSPATPTGASPQALSGFVASDVTIANIVVSGTNVIWYVNATDAAAGTNPIATTTQLVSGNTYYAVSVVGSCRSSALAVMVTVALETAKFNLSDLKYYPNPIVDVFTVSYSQTINSVEIYDLSGRVVIKKASNSNEVSVNMTDLSASIYIVKVFSEDKSTDFKVIKK